MPWNNQNGGNGGPWGGGGGGRNGGPWGQGPQNQGPNPPDLEEMIRKGQERLKQVFPGGGGSGGSGGGSLGIKGIGLLALGAVAIWMATGFYTVKEGELGVELLLGQPVAVSTSGLNYNLPYPVGRAETVNVDQIRDVTIGSREFSNQRGSVSKRDVPEESLMLTGDENIIDVDFKVQWNIKDPQAYLFNVDNPEIAVKQVVESAMREIVGRNTMDEVQTGDRVAIQVAARELTQKMLDKYDAGVNIIQVQLQGVEPPEQVIDAFRDVQTAKADKVRMQNEAQAYANKVVPEAEGQAAKILEAANAYREQTVADARGQAQRFTEILGEYEKAPDITRKRIYLETMEEVLSKSDKIILDSKAEGGSGVVPYLPLNELTKKAGN